jgi:effector-binding domain-containing protein
MRDMSTTLEAGTPGIVELPERQVAIVRIDGTTAELPGLIGDAFNLTSRAISNSGAAFAGPPFARYYTFGERISAEAGFPFTGTLDETDRVRISSLPGGRAVTTTHAGAYEAIGEAWDRARAWLGEHDLAPAGAPWECYLTGPDEPGPPITEIYFPVR